MAMDEIAKLFLTFSHETILLPLIVLGYIWVDRSIFYHATCLLLLSMLVNPLLKMMFQVPARMGAGFALPSGHMQQSAIFYGWLAYHIRSFGVRLAIVFLLIGIAWSLVNFGYHKPADIIAGVLAALVIASLYGVVKNRCAKALPLFCSAVASVLMLCMHFQGHGLSNANWLAYYALLGFLLSVYINPTSRVSVNKQTIGHKLLATLICFGSIFLVRYCFKIWIFGHHLPVFIVESQWLAVGFMIPSSTSLSMLLCYPLKKHKKKIDT
jgi:undecaprenyl-diphosphatase